MDQENGDDSSDYQVSMNSKQNRSEMVVLGAPSPSMMMQPQFIHGNMAYNDPKGNNTDLESITQSKPQLIQTDTSVVQGKKMKKGKKLVEQAHAL